MAISGEEPVADGTAGAKNRAQVVPAQSVWSGRCTGYVSMGMHRQSPGTATE